MIHDTMFEHKTLYCEKGVPHGLPFIGSIYSDIPFYKDDVKGEDNFALLPDDVMRTYNCRDLVVTDQANECMQVEIDQEGLRHVYEFDMRMLRPLVNLQRRGVLIDKEKLKIFQGELDAEIAECEEVIRKIVGDKFNPSSPKQLADLLFNELSYRPVGFTATRQPKTDLDAIIAVSEQA